MLNRRGLDRRSASQGEHVAGRWWLSGCVGAAISVALATVIYTVAVVFRLHVVLPIWDEWAWVSDVRDIWRGSYDWAELFRPHNEHRIVFPRLIMLMDAYYFSMGGWFVLAVTFLLQAINAVLISRLVFKLTRHVASRLLLTSLMFIVLFSLRQRDNLDNVFQVQFVGVYTAAMAAVICHVEAQARWVESRLAASRFLAAAALGCVIATYTMANGVMAGFVLVVLALLLRAAWPLVVITLVFALTLALAFFYHYSTPDSPSPAYLFSHLSRCLAYLLSYLGNPFSTHLFVAQVFGVLGLLGLATAAWWVAARRTTVPAHAALVGIAGFILATGCTTVYGRASLGISQALESRYVTPVSLFWCAVVCFWVPVVVQRGRRDRDVVGRAFLAVSISGLAVASLWFEITAWPEMNLQAAVFRQFRDSLQSRLFDPVLTAQFENWPDEEIRTSSEFLRTARLSLYAEPREAFLGRRITDLGPVTEPQTCSGAVASADPDPQLGQSGIRLKGVAHDDEHRGAIRSIVVTNDESVVVGYGSLDRSAGSPGEWLGYARSAANAEVQAFGVLSDGRFCRLGTAMVATSP